MNLKPVSIQKSAMSCLQKSTSSQKGGERRTNGLTIRYTGTITTTQTTSPFCYTARWKTQTTTVSSICSTTMMKPPRPSSQHTTELRTLRENGKTDSQHTMTKKPGMKSGSLNGVVTAVWQTFIKFIILQPSTSRLSQLIDKKT